MKQIVAVLTTILFLVPLTTLAQEPCEGNFDCDQDVDGTDAAVFKADFGRSPFKNPCPSCPPPAPVPKTGQTNCFTEDGVPRLCEWCIIGEGCFNTGEDGCWQSGVTLPDPRFAENGDGTVTDNLTGLIWLKDANCIATNYSGFDSDGGSGDGRVTWQHALDFVKGMNDGTYSLCGMSHTDWRLANINELNSLIDRTNWEPALSIGHPFNNITIAFGTYYWSSTSIEYIVNNLAWVVFLDIGNLETKNKTENHYVWPIRGGH